MIDEPEVSFWDMTQQVPERKRNKKKDKRTINEDDSYLSGFSCSKP